MFQDTSSATITAPWPPIPLFVEFYGSTVVGVPERPPSGETAVVYDVNGD